MLSQGRGCALQWPSTAASDMVAPGALSRSLRRVSQLAFLSTANVCCGHSRTTRLIVVDLVQPELRVGIVG